MVYSSSKSYKNKYSRRKYPQTNLYNHQQHGYQKDCPPRLLSLPSETLTHITSFLDPPSLVKLARICRALYEHVNDDNTWHRAFVCQVLGINPDRHIADGINHFKARIIRRFADTWRKELILRYNFERRWALSRTRPTVYQPSYGHPISSILVLPNHSPPALLAFSKQSGIVTRSFPLSGKRLYCCMDTTGLGLDGRINPAMWRFLWDEPFAVAHDGIGVKLVWGADIGVVHVMIVPNPFNMKDAQINATLLHSAPDVSHTNAVTDIAWGAGPNAGFFVTGSQDNHVKLWNASEAAPVWSSTSLEIPNTLPIVKVAYGAAGVVAAVDSNGDIIIFSGLDLEQSSVNSAMVRWTRIPCPVVNLRDVRWLWGGPIDGVTPPTHVLTLQFCGYSTPLSILVAYKSHVHFYCIDIDMDRPHTPFAFKGTAPTTSISLCPAREGHEASEGTFVLVGDQLGWISVYDWDARSGASVYTFSAHSAAVTSIAHHPDSAVIASGSKDGLVKVWDAVDFHLVRTFVFGSDVDGMVGGGVMVTIFREMVIAYEGFSLLAWKLGEIGREKRGHEVKKWKRKREKNVIQQHEFAEGIAEYEHTPSDVIRVPQSVQSSQKEQQAELERLGLDEEEVVSYLMMLSQEEEEARRRSGHVEDEEDAERLPAAEDFPPIGPAPSTSTSLPKPTSVSWSDVVSQSVPGSGNGNGKKEDEEDEDLRLAIELSLRM